MPDAGKLPRVRGAVVPLVRTGDAVVGKLVADRLPGFAPVVGALHRLSEPIARLRSVEPVRIRGRPLEVIHLPTREERVGHPPILPLFVRCQNERALARANQYPYPAHSFPLPQSTIP